MSKPCILIVDDQRDIVRLLHSSLQSDRYGVPRICFVNKMDRGASYERTIEMVRERLGANPIAVQMPIGSEASFIGAVDLIAQKAIVWEDDLGKEPRLIEIPAELRNQVEARRERMIEQMLRPMMS